MITRSPAPWTAEQVQNLLDFQQANYMHPFTCANRGDGSHIIVFGDLGTLVPTVRGWVCLCCDYTQDWAHDFMLNGEALRIAREGPDTIP